MSGNILALAVAAIALIMMLVIQQGMIDSNIVDANSQASFTNATLTDATPRVLACSTRPGASCGGITAVTNATSGHTVAASNYTQNNCLVTDLAGPYAAVSWNVTYSCTYGEETYLSTNKTLVGMGTFGDFWQIIVLSIVGAIVIGIIFSAFGGAKKMR